MRLQILAGMLEELEKIGASRGQAGYMQSRRGTRPYRVDTLLGKQNQPGYVEPNTVTQNPEQDQPNAPELAHDEGDGDVALGKTAAPSDPKERVMHGFASARPYVASGVTAGVPSALLGNVFGGKRGARIGGVLGATAGATNEYLRQWAEKNRRKAVAKKLLEGQE
jgi:hypothetical protein